MKPLTLTLLLCAGIAAADDLAPALRAGLVQLHVESQDWEAREPWKKRPERTRTGRGFVVEKGVVLTPADVVADQLMIEVSVANSARRYPARLKHVDRGVGLALVEITDADLAATLAPLPIGEPARLDQECDLWQLGQDNLLERYDARVVAVGASGPQLTLRIKTTCADNGDGQVAIRAGKVAGLLTSTVRGRQEGTLLGVETLRRYLDDFADSTYHGAPSAGIWYHTLLRDDLRAYYGVPEDRHGIAVSRVMKGRTGDGVLREGDVLLAVDGYDLDDEGRFVHEVHGRLSASWLFQGRRYAGDRVKARILRDGSEREVELELRSVPESELRVPDGPPGGRPQYLVVGGLVILELTADQPISRSTGGVILRRYRDRANWDPPDGRRRIVFIDHVLSDAANKGYEELEHMPIRRVNGVEITEIADVPGALGKPVRGFHVFELEGTETDVVLPAADLPEIDARIARTYRVTRPRYLVGDDP